MLDNHIQLLQELRGFYVLCLEAAQGDTSAIEIELKAICDALQKELKDHAS